MSEQELELTYNTIKLCEPFDNGKLCGRGHNKAQPSVRFM